MTIGLDVGSTTMKVVALDEQQQLIHAAYRRHYSQIRETGSQMLADLLPSIGDQSVSISLSGSAGMGLSQHLKLPFIQEVYATRLAVNRYLPSTDV
ncbi:MAG: CoA activase, partial [Spirochaetales bacterium]|nr:CoA activase [Spirochaetales bacterium]